MKNRYFLAAALFIIGMFVFGIVGWVIGASIGGNIDSNFTYQGLPGYEGAGILGSHIGIALSVIVAAAVIWKKHHR